MRRKIRRNWIVPEGAELTDLDRKILAFQEEGFLVPSRKLIKTPEQIEGIRRSGVVNTGVLDLVAQEIHAGMTTLEIDEMVYDYTVSHGAIPAPLNYEGFPKVYVLPLTRWSVTAFLMNSTYWRKEILSMWTFPPYWTDITAMLRVCLSSGRPHPRSRNW